MAMLTFQFRVKDAGTAKYLEAFARKVNFAWNYANETSFKALRYDSKWLSHFDLNYLTSGASKELGIHSSTLDRVNCEYATRRKQFKKRKLRWRSSSKSLGWVPFLATAVKLEGDRITYCKKTFRLWKHREIEGKIKSGSFTQDSRGRWYVNFQCDVGDGIIPTAATGKIGIDLGCKDKVVTSDGKKFGRFNLTQRFEAKLAKAQRAKKKRQVTNIHAKIKNKRKDWSHKVTKELAKTSKYIVIGDISSSKLAQTKMAKSVLDSGFAQIKSMLAYKAARHGVDFKEIQEHGTTVTCSGCLAKSGPSGLSGLSVREWICSECGAGHDRDVNAAKNILRIGQDAPNGKCRKKRKISPKVKSR